MEIVNEVTIDKLKWKYDIKKIINKRKEVNNYFPGNSNIHDLLETILKIKNKQHIYISAKKNSKIEELLINYLNKRENKVFDWVYVYNFKEPNRPSIIKLDIGKGELFKQKIEQNVSKIFEESKQEFHNKSFKEIRNKIKLSIIDESEKELETLKEEAKKLGFSTHIGDKGIFFIPIINGKKISESEYDNLNANEQERIINDLNILEKKSSKVLKKINQLKKKSQWEISNFKRQILTRLIEKYFQDLGAEDWLTDIARNYIINLKKNLYKQLEKMFITKKTDEMEKINEIINSQKTNKEIKNKYSVNLLEKQNFKNIPVIYSGKNTYYELFGKIQYINESGVFTTDISLIKPGLMHMANGGFLILDINDLITSKMMWDKLKKTLMNKSIEFDPIREQLGALPIKTMEPESIPLDINVILIGDDNLYRALIELDEEFKNIFPYKLNIPETINVTEQNLIEYYYYFKNKKISDYAVKRLLEYSIKYTGNKNKLSTNLVEIEKLVDLSKTLAKESGENFIKSKHIKLGELELKKYRKNILKPLEEHILSGQLIIDVEGKKIGQINGLSISKYMDVEIALPIRITASAYKGEGEILSIEKDNKLAGRIFSKSVDIISSYINGIFSHNKPLPFNCNICFEQVYLDIEGDSASCAETYAILSALAKVPINQNIAITGSMDQHGNIQAIGSASNKIEGFYNVCKLKGLTGDQGVIIPEKNLNDIILDDEIMLAIKKQMFHIYTINTIEEGVPLLMGMTFSKLKSKINNLLKYELKN